MNRAINANPVPHIRFDMAFDCLPRYAQRMKTQIWLGMETSGNTCRDDKPSSRHWITWTVEPLNSGRPLKRACEADSDTSNSCGVSRKGEMAPLSLPKDKDDKGIEICDTASVIQLLNPSKDIMPKLDSRQNVCQHLHQSHQENETCQEPVCVGVFSRTDTFGHLDYPHPQRSSVKDSVSLETVIPSLSASARPLESGACAARIVSSDGCLPETWRSYNVHSYGTDADSLQQRGSLRTSFPSVMLPNSQLHSELINGSMSRSCQEDFHRQSETTSCLALESYFLS